MIEEVSDSDAEERQSEHHSGAPARRTQAVCVRKLCKHYGTDKSPIHILNNLNMTVYQGAIYGLLGASGCGKTTLLSCIIGRKRASSGQMWVLGGTPGTRGSGVPGRRIGYMPQEIALYDEFTIRETMLYFGWINDMTTPEIEQRLAFLVHFLMLPEPERLVGTLSGGQMRRVSLATALLHEPELLILDEPTVGVDPLLRHNIWEHLLHITKEGRTTVIITTHYIEETRQASQIGLMRGGCLLAEESPDHLIQHFQVDSLEGVFLKLSILQNRDKRRSSSVDEAASVISDDKPTTSSKSDDILLPNMPPGVDAEEEGFFDDFKYLNKVHVKTIMWKNVMWVRRNFGILLFVIGLPIIQSFLFCWTVGHDPMNLRISVTSYELNKGEVCRPAFGCASKRLSCNYLDYLERKTLRITHYDTEEEAIHKVKKGGAWTALVFHKNFSDSLRARLYKGRKVSDDEIDWSLVRVHMDMSDEIVGNFLKRDLYFSFMDFFQDYLQSCNLSRRIGTIPVRFNAPIYGTAHPDFRDFIAPGVVLTCIYFLAVALTTGAFLIERTGGTMERTLVNGVTQIEMLVAQLGSQMALMVAQAAIVLIIVFGIFDTTNNGSMQLTILLTLLCGLCGMCFGFLIATVCDSERAATSVALGNLMPTVVLCGIMWPIQGMHPALRAIAYFFPLTESVESMRSIVSRGWHFSARSVHLGFMSIILWILIFLAISVVLLKRQKN